MTKSMRLQTLVGLVSIGVCSGSLGESSCPCIEWANLGARRVGGFVEYQPVKGGPVYKYPDSYGSQSCKAHDKGLAPFCDGSSVPTWCESSWCYVDVQKCDKDVGRSVFFEPGNQLYYSYETCGSTNSYETWSAGSNKSVQLMLEVNAILASTRQQTQTAMKALTGTTSSADCNKVADLCTGSTEKHWKWGVRVDFRRTGAWMNPSANAADTARATCAFDAAEDTFLRVAAKEADQDGGRIGYIYQGDQDTGSIVQWPDAEWCPKDYDPRLRPWYASGATSPKDVLVVVDVSGSMAQGTPPRKDLSKEAVKAILKTVTWKDFIGVILFNDGVAATYADNLVPATEEEKIKIEKWVDDQQWAHRGTNFRAALGESFDMLGRSIKASKTSTCQKMILFLTDGEDPDFKDYAGIQAKATDYGTFIFTYALGTGADTTVSKKLACQNNGVFHKVNDGDDLGTIMSKYYEYFAAGQHICTASSIKFKDAVTNSDLYTSCLPTYTEEKGDPKLLGVSCMDYSVVADIDKLRKESDWDDMICKISDASKVCRPLDLTECHRQKIRADVGADSVCTAADTGASFHDGTGSCDCLDPSCKDNENFVDEQGYFCDQWVGDRCDEAESKWSYSATGQAALLLQCKRSCGLCKSGASYCSMTRTCPKEVPTPKCRACVGTITGADIDGNDICCASGGKNPCKNKNPVPVDVEQTEDSSSMVIIIVCVVVAVVLLVGGGIGFYMVRSSRKKSSPVTAVSASAASAPPMPSAPPPPPSVAPPPAEVGRRSGTDLPPQKVPGYWDNQSLDTNFCKLIQMPHMIADMQALVMGTYKKVKTSDRGSAMMPEMLTVVSVQRNENRLLWQRYAEGKEAIRKQRSHRCTPMARMRGGEVKTLAHLTESGSSLGRDLLSGVNEVYAWHGTSPAGMQAIMNEGFKMRFAGTNAGTMYGAGIYLAECSSKSDEYSKDDKDGPYGGLHCLLLCRVVLGEALGIQVGGKAVHDTIKASMDSGAFNSVMGDREASVGTYRELIVYTEDQVYPEFAIIYRRS